MQDIHTARLCQRFLPVDLPNTPLPRSMWHHRHVSWIRTVAGPLALLCKVPSGSTWAMRNKRIPCNAIPNVSPPREPMKGYRQACLPSRVYPPQQALPVHKPSFHKHSEFAWAATMAHQALPVQQQQDDEHQYLFEQNMPPCVPLSTSFALPSMSLAAVDSGCASGGMDATSESEALLVVFHLPDLQPFQQQLPSIQHVLANMAVSYR